jgi:uncharacterized membrane protein
MKKSYIFMIVLIAILFIVSIYAYPKMPQEITTHWGIYGESNGTMSKFWGLFLLPLMTIAITFLLIVVPRIDPLRKNIQEFRRYYHGFIIIFILFMLAVQSQIISWNLGFRVNINWVLPIFFGILFFYVGILLKHSKRNWFIGIRTPWTLSSDEVWDKTHQLGSKLFMLSGILSIIGVLFQNYALFFVLIPIILCSIFLVVYSYFIYKKNQK